MISTTLLKQTIKENWVFWSIFTGIQALLLVTMGGTATVAMSAMTYYAMLPGILAGIYIIVTGNKLIAAQVDRGSMAYILSTPTKRISVTLTQTLFFAGSLLLMFIITSTAHIMSTYLSAGITAGEVGLIIKLNFGLFALSLAFSGIIFLASCFFNLSKNATSTGGGLIILFLLLPIVSLFGSDYQWLKNLSIVSLFEPTAIVMGGNDYIWKFIILAAIGAVTYIAGSYIFTKRDLPL